MAKLTRDAALLTIRQKLAILRRKGVYAPKNPRAAPTDYALRLLRRNVDVIEGRASVVRVPDRAVRSEYRAADFRTTRKGVIVPTDALGDRPRYVKSEKSIVKYSKGRGATYRSRILKTPVSADGVMQLPDLREDEAYALPMKHGKRIDIITRASKEDLLALIMEYQNKPVRPYKEAFKYIQIVKKIRNDLDDADLTDEDYEALEETPVAKRKRAPRKKSKKRKADRKGRSK